MYDSINFIENGFLNIIDSMIDNVIQIDVNFIPSRNALDLVFFPKIIDEIKIEMIGINNFITLVGIIKK